MSRQRDRSPDRGGHPAGARGAVARLLDAWAEMHADQRLAAGAALGLFVTMFLPWYTKTDVVVVKGVPHPTQNTFTAFGAFSFVEAAVLLVSVFVLVVVFARAEGRAFHLPGGDGTIIMLAGAWTAILVFYRLFAKPTLQQTSVVTATEGVTWGIFVALMVAIALAYAGWRMRAASRPEPPLVLGERDDARPVRGGDPPARGPRAPRSGRGPARTQPDRGGAASAPFPAPGEEDAPADSPDAPPTRIRARPRYPEAPAGKGETRSARPAVTREDAAQLSFDDPPVGEPFADDPPVARRPR